MLTRRNARSLETAAAGIGERRIATRSSREIETAGILAGSVSIVTDYSESYSGVAVNAIGSETEPAVATRERCNLARIGIRSPPAM